MAWQPIETAPKNGMSPLLLFDGRVVIGWWGNDGWYTDDSLPYSECGPRMIEPSHWMPPPEPPTEGESK